MFQNDLGFKMNHGKKSQFLQILNFLRILSSTCSNISEDILQSDDIALNVQKITQFITHFSNNIFEIKAVHTLNTI